MPNRIKTAIKHNSSLLTLHFTVFIWGFTGLLGALITIPATELVWYRVLIASLTLLLWLISTGTSLKISKIQGIKLLLTGAILGLHWILFFYSIKISTVSVTLVSLSSITLFTSILEPIINRKNIKGLDVITGLIIIAGISLIFTFESHYSVGIITGLLSALCASSFSIINSKLVKSLTPESISFYELSAAWFWLSAYFLLSKEHKFEQLPTAEDWIYLGILGVICTAVAYVAGVSVMKKLNAFTVALTTNLEPVYGIILAYLFLGKREEMSLQFYVGSILVLGSIFLYPYLKKKINK